MSVLDATAGFAESLGALPSGEPLVVAQQVVVLQVVAQQVVAQQVVAQQVDVALDEWVDTLDGG